MSLKLAVAALTFGLLVGFISTLWFPVNEGPDCRVLIPAYDYQNQYDHEFLRTTDYDGPTNSWTQLGESEPFGYSIQEDEAIFNGKECI